MEETKDAIRGRLLAAGADLAKVLIVNGDETPPRGDKAAWGSILAQANEPVLVIADPLGEAMGKHNASDDREVRESMNDLLRSLRIEEDSRTFVGIKHFVKMNRQDAAQTDPLNHISQRLPGMEKPHRQHDGGAHHAGSTRPLPPGSGSRARAPR